MKKLILIPLLLFGACATTHDTTPAVQGVAALQDEGDMGGMSAEDMAAMMKFITPSEGHADLAKFAGDWTAKMSVWMAPGMDPMPMSMTSNARMIMGGRYLQEDVVGEFMGEAFEGMNIIGFNNGTEQVFSMWIDNMGTGISNASGFIDAEGVISLVGQMQSAEAPAGSPYRSEMRVAEDGNSYHVAMFAQSEDGSEYMNMEMHYKRVMAERKDGAK